MAAAWPDDAMTAAEVAAQMKVFEEDRAEHGDVAMFAVPDLPDGWMIRLRRNTGVTMAWCGYVLPPGGVPPDFDESDLKEEELPHGGITCQSRTNVGFDCAHANIDFCPKFGQFGDVPIHRKGAEYRTFDYVVQSAKSLALGLYRVMLEKGHIVFSATIITTTP